MESFDDNSFEYNANGIRIKKNETEYELDGTTILSETKDGKTLRYYYANSGIVGFIYNSVEYYYQKNIQGDITAIYREDCTLVGEYVYDAWGNCTVTTDIDGIATLNPFRYRGYYFDSETGLYYLNTRYYAPDMGRFISPDSTDYLDPGTVNGLNLYAYCGNNPIVYSDPNGNSATLAVVLGIIAVAGFITTCIGVGTSNNIVTAIGLTMVAIPALISGGIALIGGITAGATLTAVIGGITMGAGIGSSLFASAEYQEAFTANNWMLSAGISEDVYNHLMITVAAIATLGTLFSGFSYSFKIDSITEFGNLKGSDYKGIKFIQQTKNGKMYRSLEFHYGHAHKGHNPHWQLNKWSKSGTHLKGGTAWWSILLKRL